MSAKESISPQLDAFLTALKPYGLDEAVVSNIRALAESVKTEAAMRQPDQGRIAQQLDRIKALLATAASAAVPVADFAAAIESIRSAVGHL
ncbi:MAG TPA: hypothetical protein VH373_16430 [Jatrophihabitantaceae bacterium]